MNRKQLARDFPQVIRIVVLMINYLPFNNRFSVRGRGNRLVLHGLLRGCQIRIKGHNNRVVVGDLSRLRGARIMIHGDDNLVELGNRVAVSSAEFHIEDSVNVIRLGYRTNLAGCAHLACTEGSSITIGEECLFSSEVVIRTGDSHSLLTLAGERINRARSVVIGDRVWLGHRVIILKGVEIKHDSVVATGAVVAHSPRQAHVVLGGVPARVMKTDIKWDPVRL